LVYNGGTIPQFNENGTNFVNALLFAVPAELNSMHDEELALQAVSDAQRILEEYLKPQPRNNERAMLDELVEILGRPDLIVAVGRMHHR
jgi:hypothetical protein